MTACPSCDEATVNPHSGMFHAGCQECEIRALAHGLQYAKAQASGRLSETDPMSAGYVLALKGIFGDKWLAGHQRVKQAALRMLG